MRNTEVSRDGPDSPQQSAAGFGRTQNQAVGYLFPMGAFSAAGRSLGLSPWLVQRAWIALVMSVALTSFGVDLVTAVSAVISCMNNLGPALGQAGANYADIGTPAKWVLSLAMVMGRLELYTLLVLFTPVFWRD